MIDLPPSPILKCYYNVLSIVYFGVNLDGNVTSMRNKLNVKKIWFLLRICKKLWWRSKHKHEGDSIEPMTSPTTTTFTSLTSTSIITNLFPISPPPKTHISILTSTPQSHPLLKVSHYHLNQNPNPICTYPYHKHKPTHITPKQTA